MYYIEFISYKLDSIKINVSKLHYWIFVHPIFLSFGFWYFGHFRVVWFSFLFLSLAHVALQNVNKDYIIFPYFHKSDQKPKTKMGWTKQKTLQIIIHETFHHTHNPTIVRQKPLGTPNTSKKKLLNTSKKTKNNYNQLLTMYSVLSWWICPMCYTEEVVKTQRNKDIIQTCLHKLDSW